MVNHDALLIALKIISVLSALEKVEEIIYLGMLSSTGQTLVEKGTHQDEIGQNWI